MLGKRLILLLALAAPPALAQEEPESVDNVAEAAVAAKKADAKEFAQLAARDEPDPWLVADRIARGGDADLALRFARLSPRPAVDGLDRYLRNRAAHPPANETYAVIDRAQLRLEDDRATQEQLKALRASLGAALNGANALLRARLLSLRGFTNAYLGDVDASRSDFEAAARTAAEIEWLREAADALGTASENARVLYAHDDAVALARRELELRFRLKDEARVVEPARRLASLHREGGTTEDALRDLERWQQRLDKSGSAELALERANIELQRAALDHARRILANEVHPQSKQQQGRTHMLAGDVLRQLGLEEAALKRYRLAVTDFERAKETALMARALGNAGVSIIRLGRPKEAVPVIERAQTLFDAARDRNMVALAVLYRGDAHLAAGNAPVALRLYTTVRTYAARTGDGWLEGNALLRRGRALFAQKEHTEAHRAFAACSEIGQLTGVLELSAGGAAGEARCLIQLNKGTRAQEAVERGQRALRAMVDGKAVPAGDEARRIHDDLAAVAVHAALLLDSDGTLWRAVERRRLGLPLRDADHARRVRSSAMTAKQIRDEQTLRRTIRQAGLAEERARQEEDRVTAVRWKLKREEAVRRLDDLVDAVRLRGRPGWQELFPQPAIAISLSERIATNEALICYAVSDGPAAALVLTRSGMRRVALGPSRILLAAIGAARPSDATSKPDTKLRRLLLEPLGLRASAERVLIALPPELRSVPFAALDPERRYVRVGSGTEFDLLRGRRFASGDGTATKWTKGTNARLYIGPAPTAGAIESTEARADVALLSAPVRDIATLRAFQLRRTPAIVAPLWQVDAYAAEAFRKKLAELLTADDAPEPSVAVQRARDAVRRTEGWEHPAYWAAWTLWGR